MTLSSCSEDETTMTFDATGVTVGEQVIALQLELREHLVVNSTPAEELWDVTLKDLYDNIVDMYPDYSSLPWDAGFGIDSVPFEWTRSSPGQASEVIFNMRVFQKEGTLKIRRMCFGSPKGFRWQGNNKASVAELAGTEASTPAYNISVSELKPQPPGWSWAEAVDLPSLTSNRLCVDVDSRNVTSGFNYVLTLPVIVPLEIKWPADNMWSVDMCNFLCIPPDNVVAENAEVLGRRIRFSLFGFLPLEEHPNQRFEEESGAVDARFCVALTLVIHLSTLIWLSFG